MAGSGTGLLNCCYLSLKTKLMPLWPEQGVGVSLALGLSINIKQKVSVWGFNACNTKPHIEVLCNSNNVFFTLIFPK